MTQCFHKIFTEIEIKSNEIESVVLEEENLEENQTLIAFSAFQK